MSVQFYASLVHVCHYLDHRDIATLLKVSSAVHVSVGVALARDINRLLRVWITPLSMFWSTLDASGGVIAGSFVLRLLDSSAEPWPPGSLDIYVTEQGSGAQRMMAFFRRFTPFDTWMASDFPHVPRPLTFTYPPWGEELAVAGYDESSSDDGRKVRLFRVRSEEPLDAIPYTFSTSHVNFLTSNILVCAYPRATLHQRGFVPPTQWKNMDHWILSSFAGRGYRIRDFVMDRSSDGEARDLRYRYDPQATRSFGDPECLRFPVERGALGSLAFPVPVYPSSKLAESVSWRYGTSGERLSSLGMLIDAMSVRATTKVPIIELGC